MDYEDCSDDGYLDFKLPSIVNQIKRLLEQYSDGQILKELVQNAEDGDATEMKVAYVTKEHQYNTPSKSWKGDAIKFATKGPALCVYNNGIFSDEDWEGVAAIQCSIKENEPLKVGRFGLGFKSVFHITDHPMILSGTKMMVMNPLTKSGRDVVYHKNLKNVDDSSREAMLNIMDGIFEFSSDVFQDGYNGTMFWFPLRVAESDLSKVTYDDKKICDIFRGFRTTAPSMLLFLKQIGTIELHELKDGNLNLIYCVQKRGENIEYIRTKRNIFFKKIEDLHGRLAQSSLSNLFTQKIRCEGFGWLEERVSETSWLVMDHYQGGSVSRELKALTDDVDWSYSPYVSIAVALSEQSTSIDGHIFCFLPLPQERKGLTGLPVHVNGFFALSQDRHHIKWTSSEQDINSHTEKSVQWNKLLVSEVLPRVYADIMKEIITDTGNSAERVYSMLPNPQFVSENWTSIIDPLFKFLFSTQIIYTKHNTGKWILPHKALILSDDSCESILMSLEEVYLLLDKTVARVPTFVTNMLTKHGAINYTSVDKLWSELKASDDHIFRKMNRNQQINLLRYFLNTDRQYLQDLQLLPLANNTFTAFSSTSTDIVYICSEDEYAMFPKMEVHFVDLQIDDKILQQLADISEEGQFQLRTLQASAVPHLLEECIFQNKFSSKKITRELDAWLTSVWRYIGKHKSEIVNHIAHLPLLPWQNDRNNSKLIKLNCLSILKSKYGVGTLEADITNALEKLHVTVFTSIPDNIMDIVSGKYVQFPTEEGIFKCLQKITSDEALLGNSISSFNSKATINEKKILLVKLSDIDEIRILGIKVFIRRLRLFSLTGETKMDKCLEDVNKMYVETEKLKIPVKPVSKLLKCSDHSAKRLAEMCGAEIITFDALVEEILLNLNDHYSSKEIKQFMIFFLNEFSYFETKEVLMGFAQGVKFVENKNGIYCRPCDLMDPTSQLLRDLFVDEQSKFPKNTTNIAKLKTLGLQIESTITNEDILKIGSCIHDKSSQTPGTQTLLIKAQALCKFIDQYTSTLATDTIQELSTKSILPIKTVKPLGYPINLPFAGEGKKYMLVKACEIYKTEYVNLIGGGKFVANDIVPGCFHKFCMPPGEEVWDQLLLVSSRYNVAEYDKFICLLTNIYHFLNTKHMQFPERLKNQRVVWTGSEGNFQIPRHIWIKRKSSDLVLEPYLYCLPSNLLMMTDLFLRIGCVDEQTEDMLISTLDAIKSKNESKSLDFKIDVKTDLSLVIQIVNGLSNSPNDLRDKILLPIFTNCKDILQLKPPSECTICNEGWLGDLVDDDAPSDSTDTIFYVHEQISKTTAEQFKVPLLTDRVLSNVDAFDMNFGQNEPLTTRLRNILEDYTDGFTIPKELIQNADDAGATVVKFMYDERTLPEAQKCLFNEGMLPCQGPAFWAFNDAQFQSADFDAITRLAGATKKQDSMKIGRFGLGFNSVYNLTDVPSFISGDTYVIFDPHKTHLKRCGLKVKLNEHKNYVMRQKMKGQFYPFEGIFGCEVINKDQINFKGTLFRFPLRSQEEASKSEIKDLCYSKSEMKEFVRKLEECAGNLLLFTQNVKKIELFYLAKGAQPRDQMLLMEVGKSSDHSTGSVLEYLCQGHISDHKASQLSETIEIKLTVSEFSKDFCAIEKLDCTKPFLVSWSFGKNKALEAGNQREFNGLLPVAATAVSLENCSIKKIKSTHGFYEMSHLFCFLPLPITSQLPVHINASFAVNLSRRELVWQNEDDKDIIKDKWNKLILADAGSEAYILMLQTLAPKWSAERYFELWPTVVTECVSRHDHILSKNVYRNICTENYKVFPSGDMVVSLNEAVFLDPTLREEMGVGSIAFKAFQHFVDIEIFDVINDSGAGDVYVVELSHHLSQQFQHAQCEQYITDRTVSMQDFYSKIVFSNLSDSYWTKEDLDELILYGLLKRDEVIDALISSYDCIPSKPNGLRKQPRHMVHPFGQIASLFSTEEECFPQDTNTNNFCKCDVLQHLSDLGIQNNDLHWDKLPERIICALETHNKKLIKERCYNFLRYMCINDQNNQKKYANCPNNIREKIGELPFLPLEEEATWLFPAYATKMPIQFIPPIEGHMPELRNLVGCTLPIIDAKVYRYIFHATDVLKWLGVKHVQSELEVRFVIDNILTMIDHYTESTQIDTLVRDLQISLDKMYSYLCTVIEEGSSETGQQIAGLLKEQPVVLHMKTLKTPDKMIMNLDANVQPYLFTMERRYHKYASLFILLGVLEQLTPQKIIDILLEIAEEKGNNKLTTKEIDCIFSLSNEFSKCPNPHDTDKTGVKLPNDHGVLTLCAELCIDDSMWLNNTTIKSVRHIHERFSKKIAESFDVKSKRAHDFESISSPIFSEFGQHEELTTRIRRILEGYPCDESILKEMLQNADDAGATEVIFIKDFRDLSKKSLPDPYLGEAQGPALCVYNNSFLTSVDLKGIQDLGLGSKKDEVLMTGQYGVGFNVVYHVTDVPSFWTKGGDAGEVICIFDPQCKYLSNAKQNKPGIQIKASGLIENYPDFIDGYIPDFTQSLLQGTLFRLPLRTKAMAKTSAINQEYITVDRIEEIINALKPHIISCMLFLENIKTIKIGSVVGGQLTIEYEVTASMSTADNEKQMKYNTYLKERSGKLDKKHDDAFNLPNEIDIMLNIEDKSWQLKDNTEGNLSPPHRETYLVIKRAGFLDDVCLPEKLNLEYKRGKIKKLPRGGVAICLRGIIDGMAYCTLPLPVKTGLPLHINGQFALDHESRRNICNDEDSVSGMWNNLLRKYLVVPAYISALGVFKKHLFSHQKSYSNMSILHNTITQFEDIFPTIEKSTDVFWKALSTDIYVSMASTKVKLFPVVKSCSSIGWVAVQTDDEFNGCFNTLTNYFKPDKQIYVKATPTYVIMEMILLDLGMKVLKSSRWILYQFQKAAVNVHIISPKTVLTFIKSFSNHELKTRCILGELPSLISKTSFKTVSNFKMVLKFVIRDIDVDKDEANCLYDSPLLLRQKDTLDVFDGESTTIVSSYCDLFQEHSSKFLSKEIVSVMKTFVGKFKPLIHWTLANFAGLFERTTMYHFLCRREIINLTSVNVSIIWVFKLWEFIRKSLPKQRDTSEPEKLSSNSSSFRLLENFSILPVQTASGECFLYPICYADHVLDYRSADSSTVGMDTSDILYALNIPILYPPNPEDITVRDYYKTLKETVAKIGDPNSILEVLLNNERCLTGIDNTRSLGVLEYFNHYIKDITSSNKNKMRRLAMFATHCSSLISLNMSNEYICLHDNVYHPVPKDGLQHWESTTGIVILRYYNQLKTLYENISVLIVEPAGLYSQFILRHIHSFKNEHHIVHFKYIRDTLLVDSNMQDRNNLIGQLNDVSFIPHSDGTMKKASAYFDHTNEVFKVMQDQSYFVPLPFNNPEWEEFLRLAGLVTKVSVELFVRYARTVEHNGTQECSDEVINQSRVLVEHLYSRENLIEEGLCQKIKGVRFIERKMFDEGDFRGKIHKLFCNTTKLTSFAGSYLERNLDYVWTVANVIETPLNVGTSCREGSLTDLLGIKSEVTTNLFVQHFRNICSSLQHKQTITYIQERKLESLFDKLYKFMQNRKLTDMTLVQACQTIYLPDEKCMANASRVILKCRPEQLIKHEIFEAPIVFGKYFNVFEMLGAREVAEPDMYLEVLQDLYCRCSGRELHPNESGVVKRCITQLNYLWSTTKISEQECQVKCLYLPSEKTIMTPSTELVLMDNTFIKERVSQLDLQYFVGFKELQIVSRTTDSITTHGMWPKKYQMNRLSKVLVERLRPDCRAVVGNISTDVNNRLKHSEMQTALVRLMRHRCEELDLVGASREEADTKLETVTDINIFEVEKLTTELFYNNQKVAASEIQRKMITVETNNTNNIYIDTDISDDDMPDLVTLLSQLVNKIFGIEMLYFSRLWELIKTNPSNISNWLDQRGIRSSDYTSDPNKYLLFPPPGQFIPEKYYWLLDNSFREFDVGEYVGFEVFDPDLEDQIPEDNPCPVYIYAKVCTILQEDTNTDFAWYSIVIGEDEMLTVNATQIYKFYRTVTAVVPINHVPNTDMNYPEDNDIKSILQEIRQLLIRAWHLPEKDRKRVIKRLLLHWHPDKNTHNVTLTTAVTQNILLYIERLRNGQTIEEEDIDFDTTDGASNSRNNYYSNFCSKMHSRGSRYAQYSEEQRSNRRYYSDNSFHTQSEPNPQPGQACRWLKQARYDLQAAKHSIDNNAATHNWICYKCQQAAEKALKAVWYMIDANKVTMDHNLNRVAAGLQYTDLVNLASDLQTRIGEHTRMRYPDTLSYPRIPHDVYDRSHSTEACQLTESIISRSSEILAGRNEL